MAAFPRVYEINGCRILFPKDPAGGGSWIAVNETRMHGVLLNGAIRAHQPEAPYRKSRGLILLDLIAESSPADAFEATDFTGLNRLPLFYLKIKIFIPENGMEG